MKALYLQFEDVSLLSLSLSQRTLFMQPSSSFRLAVGGCEPFCDSNLFKKNEPFVRSTQICSLFHAVLFFFYHSFFLRQERCETNTFLSSVGLDGGPKQGANTHYASSSTASNHTLSNSHSCECIGPLRVSNQSEHNLLNSAQRSRQRNFASMQVSTARVCFYLLSPSLVMQKSSGPIASAHSVPLDHTG